jgi:undecaprenyl diphosphate synthase
MSDSSAIPRHIAIIPDGNRRWAKARGQSAFDGHSEGARIFRGIALHAAEAGVECLSMWGMSLSNFSSRDPLEITGLLKIFYDEFTALATDADVHRLQIKIDTLGRWQEKFPAPVKAAIEKAHQATASYTKHQLNFLLAYSGTDEMLAAVQAISDMAPVKVTSDLLKQQLYTKNLPPVDLVIRTGGEPHISQGFMMWDTAESQLYFTEKFWPDFSVDDFDAALADFARRERRLGK